MYQSEDLRQRLRYRDSSPGRDMRQDLQNRIGTGNSVVEEKGRVKEKKLQKLQSRREIILGKWREGSEKKEE